MRRYEHPAPGCLVHVDIKKLGDIPQGGGRRVHGRQLGQHHSRADKAPVRSHSRHPRHGYGYLHAAVDGIVVQRVLTDNGACYRSHLWRQLLQRQGVAHKRTRLHPYNHHRPHTGLGGLPPASGVPNLSGQNS